ncbi:MAG: hypothetical protein K0R54_943 [Clostridiaceae bacterium]|jgi:hypothetical protein|nr:hypothetical protein [Clostridiaceae bacterium]
MLVKNTEYINSIYKENATNVAFQFENIERNYGIHIVIADSKNNIKYDSLHYRFDDSEGNKKSGQDFNTSILNELDSSEDSYVFKIEKDPKLQTNFLNIEIKQNC